MPWLPFCVFSPDFSTEFPTLLSSAVFMVGLTQWAPPDWLPYSSPVMHEDTQTHRHTDRQTGRQTGTTSKYKRKPLDSCSQCIWHLTLSWHFSYLLDPCYGSMWTSLPTFFPCLQPFLLVSPSLHLNVSQVLEPHTTESQSKSQRPPNGLQGIDKVPLGLVIASWLFSEHSKKQLIFYCLCPCWE